LKRSKWLVIPFMTVGLFLIGLSVSLPAKAQPHRHTVVKGDTLWDICERYYGDPDLWPKLWEMNPFITNPHLIKPGDVITLLEYVPVKGLSPAKEKPGPPAKAEDAVPKWQTAGIDVSRMINIESIGFLSPGQVEPSGHIFADETERVFLTNGDMVYVAIKREAEVKPGDLFNVYRQTPLLGSRNDSDKVKYLITFLGRIVLIEEVKDRGRKRIEEYLYKAEIVQNYEGMRVGDPIFPVYPLSACVWPTQPDWKKLKKVKGCWDLRECKIPIVCAKGGWEIIGPFSVVYLAGGFTQGIRRGNILKIVSPLAPDTPKEPALPDVTLGHILVLEARPDTATALVISATSEFSKGVFVKCISGSEVEGVLRVLPECGSK
jgi:LysM repeat protein